MLKITSIFKIIISKSRIIKSLKFRIFIITMLVGIIPSVIARQCILANYEERAVNMRTSDVLNQCKILSNHLVSSGYLSDTSSEKINGLEFP